VANNRRQGARKGSGSILPRGARFVARLDLGLDPDGKRSRRSRSFASLREAQAWIDQQRSHSEELILPVADQRLDEYLSWWLEHEAPKVEPGRAPLASTTLQATDHSLYKTELIRQQGPGSPSTTSSSPPSRGWPGSTPSASTAPVNDVPPAELDAAYDPKRRPTSRLESNEPSLHRTPGGSIAWLGEARGRCTRNGSSVSSEPWAC
jgi:hypothetical protein